MHLVRAILLLSLLAPPTAAAQAAPRPWFVRALGAWAGFSDATAATSEVPGELESVRSGSGFRYGAALGRRLAAVDVVATVQRGRHALAGDDAGTTIAISPAFTLTTVALSVAVPVIRTPAGATLNAFAGPELQRWSGDVLQDARTRIGATAGLGVVAPITPAIALDAHAALGVGGSPVDEGELDGVLTAYERKTVVRRELAVGLRLAF